MLLSLLLGNVYDYYYYSNNSQFLRNMDRPLHSIPSFEQRRHFSGLEAGVRRVTCEKQKLLNYIYWAIYFFNKELMLQQSICSWLPIVKTSHSTIPYDHLLKERMGANCFSVVVISFSWKFGHQSSYLHRNSRIIWYYSLFGSAKVNSYFTYGSVILMIIIILNLRGNIDGVRMLPSWYY